jgi:hypothetical protein
VYRSLNIPGGYSFNDGLGHDYNANICGYSSQICLPSGWANPFVLGSTVQFFGGVPACNEAAPACFNPVTGEAVCCTADCQVLGVGAPVFSLLDPLNPQAGLNISFAPVVNAPDDPFWCPWNPDTNSQYPLTVRYLIQCDKTVSGAIPLQAIQNSTMNCDYTLIFASKLACPVIASPTPSPSPSASYSATPSKLPSPSPSPSAPAVTAIIAVMVSLVA